MFNKTEGREALYYALGVHKSLAVIGWKHAKKTCQAGAMTNKIAFCEQLPELCSRQFIKIQ